MGARLLSGVLSLSSAPYSSYVPQPRTWLHGASAEAKLLWTVAALLTMARAAPPVRLAAAAALLAATIAALPRRLWQPQLVRLGGLCAVIFFFTLIGGAARDGLHETGGPGGLGTVVKECSRSARALLQAL